MDQKIINKQIRCPRLGHELTFSYCLKESGDLPCSRIVSCWSIYFDVELYLKEVLGGEKFRQFLNSRPKDKMSSLIEIIEAAKTKK